MLEQRYLRLALTLCVGAFGQSMLCVRVNAQSQDRRPLDLRQNVLVNRAAYIPPQCFTRVLDPGESVAQNPCYVCHARAQEPNQEDQLEQQLTYDFPQLRAGQQVTNDWSNLFVDRREQIAGISDAEMRAYVDRDNYRHDGVNLIRARFEHLPEGWDGNANGHWDGFTPDAYFAFDAQGFDRAPDGSPTGWRVFAYRPLPGAFLPTNGSFDDVLIRLPDAFRRDGDGREDFRVYATNLAIVEALITRRDVAIDVIDERAVGVDLDRNRQLSAASTVRYAWQPLQPASMQYVGRAELERREGRLHLAPGLFPEGTEFLHSVRYLAVDRHGVVGPAARMKELRYARKHLWLSYSDRIDIAQCEAKEAALNPDRPERFLGNAEQGLHSAWGWTYQGLIEDTSGELRPQSYEETVFCMGCHAGLAATTDSAFAFPRKLSSGPAHGFYAWHTQQRPTVPDSLRSDGRREYETYLLRNSGADAYRSNLEANAKFFTHGRPRRRMFERLARDVSVLLIPSSARAWALDKAYLAIVREQSFVLGRDALLSPATRVLREVRAGAATGIREPVW